MVISPIIDSKDVTLVKTIQTKQLIYDWINSFQIDITEEFHGHSEIYLYQCNQTKLKFFTPSNITGSSNLYAQLQKFDWFYMPDKWEHQIALKNLFECQQVLEIGCAFGSFVQAGIEAGLNIKGIELNSAAVAVAQKNNLPVECIDLQEYANLYPQSVDAVCCFQVLEHISNPKTFIELTLKILKPNGKLIICVPNSESFLKYQYNLLDLPPHHMTQWSKMSFESLEKFFPIKLENVIYEPLAEYHVLGYISSYSNRLCSGFPVAKLLFNRYTFYIYSKLLNTGLRKFLIGQSLYVQFRKI